MLRHDKNCFFIPLLLLLTDLGIVIQCLIPTDPDVIWLSEAANRYLHGGSYYGNFFEDNPPMILYFYLLPVWLANVLSINRSLAVHVFSFVLSGAVLFYLYYASQFFWQDKKRRQYFILLAVWVFPGRAFSQRPYYALVLLLPYFWHAALLDAGKPVKMFQRILVAVTGGLAVSFKPHYLLVPVFWNVIYHGEQAGHF